MSIDAVLFDKDGTLFDFQKTWAPVGHAISHAFPKAAPEDVAACLGYDLDARRFETTSPFVYEHSTDMRKRLEDVVGEDAETIRLRLDSLGHDTEQVPVDGMKDALSALSHLTLGIATNDAEAAARAHLEQFDLAAFFDFVAGYDSGFGGKPEPGQLFEFARVTDLPPSRIVMVGDSRHDLTAGRAAGMATVAVLTGAASREMLVDLADVVLGSIAELPAWLQSR